MWWITSRSHRHTHGRICHGSHTHSPHHHTRHVIRISRAWKHVRWSTSHSIGTRRRSNRWWWTQSPSSCWRLRRSLALWSGLVRRLACCSPCSTFPCFIGDPHGKISSSLIFDLTPLVNQHLRSGIVLTIDTLALATANHPSLKAL